MQLSGKAYFAKDAFMLENVSVTGIGKSNLSLEFDAYFDKSTAYVTEEKILGGTYGIEIGELADDLSNSVVAPSKNTDYSLDQKTFDRIKKVLEYVDDMDTESMTKDVEKMVTRYVKQGWKILEENAEYDSKTKKVSVGGSKIEARIITVTIDKYALIDMIEDVLDYVEDDDELYDYLAENYDQIAGLVDYGDIMPQNFDKLWEETIKAVRETVSYIQQMQINDITVELVTPKFSSKLLKVSLLYGGNTLGSLDVGEDGVKESEKITFTARGHEYVYEIKENSKDTFEATFTAPIYVWDSKTWESSYVKTEVLKLVVDYDDNEYKCSFNNVYSSGFVSGEIVKELFGFGPTTVTVDTVDIKGFVLKLDAELVFKNNDKMPKPETDITSVLLITESDINKWMDKLDDYEEALYEIF